MEKGEDGTADGRRELDWKSAGSHFICISYGGGGEECWSVHAGGCIGSWNGLQHFDIGAFFYFLGIGACRGCRSTDGFAEGTHEDQMDWQERDEMGTAERYGIGCRTQEYYTSDGCTCGGNDFTAYKTPALIEAMRDDLTDILRDERVQCIAWSDVIQRSSWRGAISPKGIEKSRRKVNRAMWKFM
eukprot:XP_017946099.1 PREDICTED: uncharacterized protein LOC108645408 isoform X2 [Xenopus tropicalis]